jgi:D-inositol-3-phosphate glycosyltransferase
MRVVMLTGGAMKHYVVPLVNALAGAGTKVVLVGGDAYRDYSLHPDIELANLRGATSRERSVVSKASTLTRFYGRLAAYVVKEKPDLFHFQFYRLFFPEVVLLNSLIKAMGKKLVYTVHNAYPHGKRGKRGYRWMLGHTYHLCDALICHNEATRKVIRKDFEVPSERLNVIPVGLMDYLPEQGIERETARRRLFGDRRSECPHLLFFGAVLPYKGLEHLVEACRLLAERGRPFKLMIAGNAGRDPSYWQRIQQSIGALPAEAVFLNTSYIPDGEVELYFKAADAVVLPYKEIYQSGVHLLAYRYGRPIVATDVGSFREDIREGVTGYVAEPENPASLADAIDRFSQEMLPDIESVFFRVRHFGADQFSWEKIARRTQDLYRSVTNSAGVRLCPSVGQTHTGVTESN